MCSDEIADVNRLCAEDVDECELNEREMKNCFRDNTELVDLESCITDLVGTIQEDETNDLYACGLANCRKKKKRQRLGVCVYHIIYIRI